MLPKAKNFDGQAFTVAHFKYDGIALHVKQRGAVCLTRRPTDLAKQMSKRLKGLFERIDSHHEVLGELYVPGRPASYVKSALAHSRGELRFKAFAVPTMPADEPFESVATLVHEWGMEFAPFIYCNGDDLAQLYYEQTQHEPDLEGFVLKRLHMRDWYKWKPVHTIDCTVTGYKWGEGKHLGLIGSLEASAYVDGELVPVAWVGGFDDATRIEISNDEWHAVGRIIEVAYQYVGSKGRLRHPRFVRFRDDKTEVEALQCNRQS